MKKTDTLWYIAFFLVLVLAGLVSVSSGNWWWWFLIVVPLAMTIYVWSSRRHNKT